MSWLLMSLFFVSCVSGCAQTDAEECIETSVSVSQSERWLLGNTLSLPSFRSDNSDCDQLEWAKIEAPKASNNALVLTEFGQVFTPDQVGDYRFQLIEGDSSLDFFFELTAKDISAGSFHNYNYYPSSNALVSVENEIWAAGVYSPQLARVMEEDGTSLEPISVGPWPVALAYAESEGLVLVAQQANDRLGLVDVESKQIIDAIWVGDEPTNVVWDAERQRAYVALGGANAVAIVDIPKRRLIKTVDAVFDPLGLAIDSDGGRLFVASHRSGQTIQYPYPNTKLEDEKDIAIIDLEAEALVTHMLEVASTINHLVYDAGTDSLWVSATSNDIEGDLNDPETQSFQHEIFALKAQGGPAQRTKSVDLSRQASSTGSAVNIHGFTSCGNKIYVAAESSNALVMLDGNSLEETGRIVDIDTPRAVLCNGSNAWGLSLNSMTLLKTSDDGFTTHPLDLTEVRSDTLKKGFSVFHSAGLGPADNRSCSSCHVKGLSDGVIWNAGPIVNQKLTRPIRWQEGTSRIGWDGYVGSPKISGYVGGATINLRPNTEQAKSVGAYLASLMPPPPANAWTKRDGSLTEEGKRGESLFAGKASCVGCHPGPVSTSRIAFENGFTPGKTDVPSLIDLSRIGAWYKNGEKRTLDSAVTGALNYLKIELSDTELADLTRYVREITAREFFVLSANLEPSAMAVGMDSEFKLTFSYPVETTVENLSLVSLSDSSGKAIESNKRADGRHLYIKPVQTLAPSTAYRIEVPSQFLSLSGWTARAELVQFTTAAAPKLRLEGDYTLTINSPALDFSTGAFDSSRTVPSTMLISAEPRKDGADVLIDFGQDLEYEDVFVIDGDQILTKDLPVPVGPAFGNGSGFQAPLIDSDDDGVADYAEGTLILSGPGFALKEVSFEFTKSGQMSGECNPGSDGEYPLTVESSTTGVTIDWGTVPALGLYVTSPGANLPGGPGQMISGGDAYFVLEADGLAGFVGPIRYGVASNGAEDTTDFHGGTLGGSAFEEGTCYLFTVFTTDFKFSSVTRKW